MQMSHKMKLHQLIEETSKIDDVIKAYVEYVTLDRFEGNRSHAAQALGVDRRTLQRWAKAYQWPAVQIGRPHKAEGVET